jgi:hypothetical protein
MLVPDVAFACVFEICSPYVVSPDVTSVPLVEMLRIVWLAAAAVLVLPSVKAVPANVLQFHVCA